MNQEEAQEILEKIVELAALLGWQTVISQTSDGDIMGLTIGSEKWINIKSGRDPLKPAH